MKFVKLFIFCNGQKKLVKSIKQYEFNTYITQNGYYIMNSKNRKTSDRHRLIFHLSHKINLKRKEKYVAL